ncbi:hypothetical protein [Paenibacillus physcomitrellae]|uniref:Uncharacterized protein n=1 Tax=Paenibacillus physcomitrellae TaxID=1619311 RepID=A0ABQ1GCR3_9BACL|nr:hypothetical protein [Paenibacillus physcomitrellae]GGA41106.1 hypothetical protein GCM10010917_27960 [Paenibacillus physcomitrellae]
MKQKETKAAVSFETAAVETRKSVGELFGSRDKLKELDLTGVEPIVYPTWKEGRYK